MESRYNSGVSNVWSHYFDGDVAALAKEGFTLDSKVNKESQTFTLYSANPNNAPKMLAFFQKNLVDEFNTGAKLGNKFNAVRAAAASEAENLDINNHDAYLLEHLHATAFQNTPLALPTSGSQESIESLEVGDLMSFAKDNYHSRNATVVSTGNITPDAVMKAIEGNLSLTTTPTTENVTRATSSFLGSEIRLRRHPSKRPGSVSPLRVSQSTLLTTWSPSWHLTSTAPTMPTSQGLECKVSS